MTSFVCVQTPGRVSWFETERHYYDDQPTLIIQFSPSSNSWFVISHRTTTRGMNRSIGTVIRLLSNFPTSDVSAWLTHRVCEPGAPLEPIVREDMPA